MPGEHHLSALITSYRSHTLETFTGSMFAAGVKPFDRVNEMPDESAEQSSYDIYRNEGIIPRTLWPAGSRWKHVYSPKSFQGSSMSLKKEGREGRTVC